MKWKVIIMILIMEHINDKFLMDEYNSFTQKKLELGLDIYVVCLIIREYQIKFIHIILLNFELSRQFTFQIRWKTRYRI